MSDFKLVSKYKPKGDQPQAIDGLVKGLKKNFQYQTLLGVTGSGKTFTMANVIQEVQKPTLIISPNKTLAAQLCQEFRRYFPQNAVEYFVSYYDYYQPEAYIPQRDIYIEKDASKNAELDRLRLSATPQPISDHTLSASGMSICRTGNSPIPRSVPRSKECTRILVSP